MELESHVLRLAQTLVEAAYATPDFETWQRTVFRTLAQVGFDVAFLKALPPHCAFAAQGFEADLLIRARDRWPVYSQELAPLTQVAERDGMAVDREVFGASRDRLTYFQELMRPQHGTASLYAHLAVGGHGVGGLMLGRSRSEFTRSDLHTIRHLLAPLSVGLAAVLQHQTEGGSVAATVTPREGEVLGLLQLGFTNPEIAHALGTSPNTVRNQVASLLAKLGATTRAELVGLTVRS